MAKAYFQDNRGCRDRAAIQQKIRINQGGVTDLVTVTGYDDVRYRFCMDQLGWTSNDAAKPIIAAQEECHRQTARPPSTRKQGAETVLEGHHDDRAFAACMQAKGYSEEVIIGPLQVEETDPPKPPPNP